MGLEPTRHCCHRHLKPARLPIPPLLHIFLINARLPDSQGILYLVWAEMSIPILWFLLFYGLLTQ